MLLPLRGEDVLAMAVVEPAAWADMLLPLRGERHSAKGRTVAAFVRSAAVVMTCGLFITGTGTEVGKTYVAALIARELVAAGLQVGVYKPAASGCREERGRRISDDAEALWEAAGRPADLEHVCPQRFLAPLAPHLAARAEGKQVDPDLLHEGLKWWQQQSDLVLVEGSGGLMSPLADELYNADLAYDFGYPLVVVAPDRLGTINETLQTLITASTFREGIPIAGIVLNQLADPALDPSTQFNRQELTARCVPPLLAAVGWNADQFDLPVDWQELSGG